MVGGPVCWVGDASGFYDVVSLAVVGLSVYMPVHSSLEKCVMESGVAK